MYAKRMTSELARLSVMIGFLSSFETVKVPFLTNEDKIAFQSIFEVES